VLRGDNHGIVITGDEITILDPAYGLILNVGSSDHGIVITFSFDTAQYSV